jgi:hypothetical protein
MSEADLVREQQSVPALTQSISINERSRLESTINLELMHEIQTDQFSRTNQLDGLHWHIEDTSKSLLANNGARRKLIDIQVGRSDVDDCETVPENVSNNYDEFGGGLDDADFLALDSDAVIPETQNGQGPRPNFLRFGDHSGVNGLNLETKSVGGEEILGVSQESSPELLRSELDEYPLDQSGLEELLQFPKVTAVVVENRKAPTSVQYALEIEPASDEIYDPSLQFSPPKSRTSVSSEKLPDAWRTYITSSNNSPKQRLDPALVFIGDQEEEDWAFIRSKEAHFNDSTEDPEVQRAAPHQLPPSDKVSNRLFVRSTLASPILKN